MKILVLNCGSSSVKYKLFDMDRDRVLARGMADRIGMPGSVFFHHVPDRGDLSLDIPLPDHYEAVKAIIGALTGGDLAVIAGTGEIQAVGHRVVHGGEYFQSPVAVDGGVLEILKECGKLAPLHNPPNIMGIRVCQKLIFHALQVAVFDTAFHQTMPDHAYMYAIPYEYYEKYRVRKYGFHGTSHKYVASRAAELLGRRIEDLKMITCHLGNGSSLCAVDGGKSKDTTMGLTPLAGLMMGTRCGDIDPAIVGFLAEKEGSGPGRVLEVLNKKSGALGISGISSDFRDLEEAALKGHARANLAIEMFSYRAAMGICSLVPALGGLDAIVFTAGIGENSPGVRSRICSYLACMGVFLDGEKNAAKGVEADVSAPGSPVRALVIPTDEEKMIARETKTIAEKVPRVY